MREYSIPEITIRAFFSEKIITGSGGDVTYEYIGEVQGLQLLLGDTDEQYSARIEKFSSLLRFN